MRTVTLSPSISHKDIQPFTKGSVHWGKGSKWLQCLGIWEYWLWTDTHFQWTKNVTVVNQSRQDLMKPDNWSNLSARPSLCGSSQPWTGLSVIFPDLGFAIETDILRSWQNAHDGSLSCGGKNIMVRKVKWKPLELHLPLEAVNQESSAFLEEVQG